jgi:peptidoglycan/xylan/chitin deacetylase (PgdA/CDA1 family)
VAALVLAVGVTVGLLQAERGQGRVASTTTAALRRSVTLVAPVLRTVRRATEERPPGLLSLPAVLSQRTVDVPILMFHRIDVLRPTLVAITRRLTVAPETFAAEMHWLRSRGYHPLRQLQLFDALERGAPLPPRPIMITFDDGYRDVLANAVPVLERYRFPATAYVITARISGPDPSFLTWGELTALEQSGVEIGSHTVHHLDLASLSEPEAWAELSESRRVLEQHLHHPVQWLAYPDGSEDAQTVALARQAGYVLAMTTRPGSLQSGSDPLELRRIEVLDTTGVRGLAALLGSAEG